jgi:sterol desaturase/sphingolipid hydroxylase (fatty acid hydroxylase superfamily)
LNGWRYRFGYAVLGLAAFKDFSRTHQVRLGTLGPPTTAQSEGTPMPVIGSIIKAATSWQFVTVVVLWVVLLPVEAVIPRVSRDRTKEPLWRRVRRNITVACIYRLVALPIAITPVLLAASHVHLWHRPAWMSGVVFLVIDLVIFDFGQYTLHWVFHKSGYLWRYHMVHHLDQHLDVTTGGRAHFVDHVIVSWLNGAALLIFAIPVSSLIMYQTLMFVFGLYLHANVRSGLRLQRWISLVFCTPRFHDIHHGRDIEYTDSNYGTVLSIWDYLFGTYSTMSRPEGFSNGLDDHGDYSAAALTLNPMFRRGRPFREVESSGRAPEPDAALV